MEKHWFDPTPPRSRRTLFTVAGSALLHGALIVAAALYPVRYAAPPVDPQPAQPISGEAWPVETLPLPPAANDPTLMPEANPESLPTTTEVTDDPPPSAEPEIFEPTPPKSTPRTTASKVRSLRSSPSALARNERSSPNGSPGARSETGAADPGRLGALGRWVTPQPPYPFPARAAHIQGSGSVRITTDGSGRVGSTSVVQSTGNALLDDNTSRFARTNWSGPPNASVTVPITYQMR